MYGEKSITPYPRLKQTPKEMEIPKIWDTDTNRRPEEEDKKQIPRNEKSYGG